MAGARRFVAALRVATRPRTRLARPRMSALTGRTLLVSALLVVGVTCLPLPADGGTKPTSTRRTTGPRAPLPLRDFKMMNYYPSDAAWTNMWTDWQPSKIDRDFATIAGMGANIVRLYLSPDTFGYPVPSATYRGRLDDAVSMAADHGLRVDLTLFDWWSDFSDTAGSTTWMTDVLARFRSDPEVAFIELKNEAPVTKPVVASWVQTEFPALERLAGSVPVTVSLTTNPALTELRALQATLSRDPPSFYDLHVYDRPGVAYSELAAAVALVAPVPVYVGETGLSTYRAAGTDRRLADADQAWYYRALQWDVHQLGLPPAAPWTFTDFSPDGVPVEANMPPSQLEFGLFRTDGAPKPAAAVMSRLFTTGTIGTGFNGDLTQGSDGKPAVWHEYCGAQRAGSWSPSMGHDGAGAVSLSNTAGDSTCWPSFAVEPVARMTPKSKTFEATAYAKGEDATGTNVLRVSWFSEAGSYLGSVSSEPLPAGTTGWERLTVVATAPPGAAYPEIVLASARNTGTVWFDDVTWQPTS